MYIRISTHMSTYVSVRKIKYKMPKLIILAPVNAHIKPHIPFLQNTKSLLEKIITRNNIWRKENGEDYIKVRFEDCTICPAHF